MSNKDQTLPGGFQGAEHPLGEDRAQTSTPPPDSRQSFDPYEFGAHTVSPSLRMELIKTQLPETPAERLYHSPASEARKTSSPVAAPAATASFAGVVRDRRVQVAGVAALLVGVALLLPRACGDQSEVASALQRTAPSVTTSMKPIESVGLLMPRVPVEPAAPTALAPSGTVREAAGVPSSGVEANDVSPRDAQRRRRSVAAASMSASSTSDDTVGRVEKDPVVNQRASTTIESPEPTRDSSNAVTPTPALGSAEPASPAPSARTQTSGKPVVNFHFAPQ